MSKQALPRCLDFALKPSHAVTWQDTSDTSNHRLQTLFQSSRFFEVIVAHVFILYKLSWAFTYKHADRTDKRLVAYTVETPIQEILRAMSPHLLKHVKQEASALLTVYQANRGE